jgi:OmpA-OmpF porin, OOP family
MKLLSRFGLCAVALLALASCQSIEGALSVDHDMKAARMAGPPSGAFNAALQQEYIGVAQTEYDESDWEHAGLFARKGAAAGSGEMVLPEDPTNWMLSADKARVFVEARDSLTSALDGGGRDMAPAEAAKAQAMYDCWLEEEEIQNEGHQPKDIDDCRSAFWDNLALVEKAIAPKPMAQPEPMPEPAPAPEPVARDYLVYFDFDKAAIRPDAASILDRVVEAMAAVGSHSVTLVGHTDTMGPDSYNQTLSVSRALAVQDYLKSKGITRGISTSGKGESDPRVPTPDQVMEQENRRVEIRIN